MPVETRYMRSDKHTINGLEAYVLGVAESSSLAELSGCTVDSSGQYFMIGIRVYIRHEDGSETEITPGETVAIYSLGTGADWTGTVSASWDCPETSLNATDAIKIDVRCMCGTAWSESSAKTIATFITEQLDASKLNASTWTVYYRLRRDRVTEWGITWWDYYFRFGVAGDDSYIEGFSYTSAVAPVIAKTFGDGLVWIVS